MRINNLKLKNIGPFRAVDMDFSAENELQKYPVIIITGENGTGKSIILDSIRSLLMGAYEQVEREIISSDDFLIESDIIVNKYNINLKTEKKYNDAFDTNSSDLSELFYSNFESKYTRDFIFEYWTSKLSSDKFAIRNIESLNTKQYLDSALSGIHKNVDVTKAISFFDYLKDSKDAHEKKLGGQLYSILEQIINVSIGNGHLSHVSRINLQPIIKVRNLEVSLDKLSSGNLYLIQRLTSILQQAYSIYVNNKIAIEELQNIPGVLLIDEAENHLHPKWQKVFLKNVLSLFPNLQIIVTTHSPFIVSSIENSRVFVCKSEDDHSIVEEETDFYSNKPVEEILLSPLFNTSNFNSEIDKLLQQRKEAVVNKDETRKEMIEKTLLEKNPEYFNYLNIEQLIKSIKK